MKEPGRFLLAPLPAAVAAGCIAAATGSFPRPLSIVVFVCLLLYAAQIVLGIPIRLLLIHWRRVSVVSHAIGGFAMTAIPTGPYVLWAMNLNGYPLSYVATFFWLMGCYGALTGFTYWLLARPDRLTASTRAHRSSAAAKR
jgi:drug/metabolite transporter (DMT)-like permease